MRAVGLIRVSTTGQAEDGCSLAMQEQKVRAYCELNDLEIMDVVVEAGVSGRALKREGLSRAMELIRAGQVGHLVIFKLDRLSRSLKQAIEVVELLQKHDCQLHSICEKLDTSTATGRFFFHITSAISTWEAETIAERTVSALQSKKARGERVGRCPYGWTVGPDGVNLIEEPTEQRNIRTMVRYRRQGMNLNQIAQRMTERGVSARNGKAVWQYQQVKTIMNRVG